ncbi:MULTISPECIES: type II toxin-antitoxin system RelE/ParE family toxin [unclassified Rhizobium]|uniref:type II toxin-antitoxin system RelE/ParE family toxin n=1 Tax=unclassified Rhizobium TaxID=2613769 RepID=UPI000CDF4AF1|nr:MULTISPECIES: type II toxin-antitoxin system RelE/ParE family toxin [Rhizobium]AVA20795.1 toxin-antitoxin system toxin RelE/ParE family protein [Rhizobium sp. NXC24]UWU22007.1 type II toxin-antitoxin system RelE/ParE family toxin [Rhizobium tropici]
MERFTVEYRPEAVENLLDIAAYVLEQSQNIKTSEGYLNRIYRRCEKIGDAPFGGVARDDLGPGIRMAVFERSVVILYIAEGDRVRITNIIAGGQDYETLLRSQQ